MKRGWVLAQEDFDRLLDWLHREREQAGVKYEEIRRNLIKLFACRGCHCPEDLADETINRVTSKLAQVAQDYKGDRTPYFYSVAKKVYLEYLRTRPITIPAEPLYSEDGREPENPLYNCLEDCMAALTPANRSLVLDYYKEEKQAKIELRKKMALQMGISGAALRLRAHRIRAGLESCVEDCMSKRADESSAE